MYYCRGVHIGPPFSIHEFRDVCVGWPDGLVGKEGTGMVWNGIMLEREILGSLGCNLLP